MAGIVVLGGAGGVGRVATEALAHVDELDEVVVADLRPYEVAQVVDGLDDPRFRAATVDVTDPTALGDLFAGADVVLNCVGPFYRFGPPTLSAAVAAGVGYVDICDDLSATRAMLELDGAARDAGVVALVGMGNSPGLANIFVKLCAEQLLDEVTGADIMHIHGGEPDEGPAVIKHRVHAMVNDVPLYVDGGFVNVRQLGEDGAAFVREEDFPGLGRYPVFPYPHPETITLPTTFPTLRRATNLGVVFPLPYFTMTQDLVRAGMGAEEPLDVLGHEVAPIDVMVALLRHERPRLLAEAGVTGPAGALRVVVEGRKDGADHRYVCTLASSDQGAGEGTGIPAALGAVLHRRGALEGGPGVHAPEAIVPVDPLLALAGEVVGAMGIGGGQGMPLVIEHIGPDGAVETLPMNLG
ncbi:MAG: saccharopine dehydrogenase NADP-binding domain-containing protein [Acidimicrobiales bacterium]|nr:saccharopine dehydrogenase NADP-binding domain-containing protein [Acidimicrobiales bacterium]MCB9371185.1 saccharopine dehydrogenase NADP-binding domain-containing protein [Microthrixaceae bacterium]